MLVSSRDPKADFSLGLNCASPWKAFSRIVTLEELCPRKPDSALALVVPWHFSVAFMSMMRDALPLLLTFNALTCLSPMIGL